MERSLRRSGLPLLVLALLLSPLSGERPVSSMERNQAQPESLRLTLENVRIEEALEKVRAAAGNRVSALCDSSPRDERRVDLAELRGDRDRLVQGLASAFERQFIRMEGHYLLRSVEWFAPPGPGSPPGPKKPKPAQALLVRQHSQGGQLLLELACVRSTLGELAVELSKAARETHRVALPLRSRRLSGGVFRVTAGAVRGLIASLFPDAEWRRAGGLWLLEERPAAAFIREIAAYAARHVDEEMRPRGALHLQVAAGLDAGQHAELERTGRLEVSWAQMGPETRDLYRQWLRHDQAISERSGTPVEYRTDAAREAALGVEFVRRPKGGIQPRCFGATLGGKRMVF